MEDFKEYKEYVEQCLEKMQSQSKFRRSAIFDSVGCLVWEESEEEYYQRMLSLGDEYLAYLKGKKEDILTKMQKEVDTLSTLINKFESKMKEK